MQEEFQPSITFPNMRGDVTISWTEENEEYIKKMIEEKMKEGYSFFVIVPRKIFGIEMPKVRTKLTDKNRDKNLSKVSEAVMIEDGTELNRDSLKFKLPNRPDKKFKVISEGIGVEIHVDDKSILAGMENEKLFLARTDRKNSSATKAISRARTADEVIKKQSVAVRPLAGG